MRRWVTLIVVGMMAAVLLAGTAQAAEQACGQRGGTVRYAVGAEPITLSPLMSGGDAPAARMRGALFDPLFHIDWTDGSLKPGIGLSLQKKSDTVYVVKIREGVQFHKGYGELTADDVAFSYNEVVQKNLLSKYSLQYLKEVRPVDRYTAEFVLEKPYAAFPVTSLTYLTMVVSRKAYQEMGPERFNRQPVGTGPFEFVEWIPGNRIAVKRFGSYWQQGLPCADGIEYLIVKDPFVRVSMLKAGQADIIDSPDLKDVESLGREPGVVIQERPGSTFDAIVFSMLDKTHPFNDPRVRKAVNLALDREEIVKRVYYGHALTTDVPTPPGFMGRPRTRMYPDEPNLAEARKLLAEAGYPKGFTTTAIVADRPNMRRELEIIASQLSKVGITVRIEAVDSGTFSSRVIGRHEFTMAVEDVVVVSPDPDSATFWFYYPGQSHNHGWNEPELTALLERGRNLTDRAERAELYLKVNDLIRQANYYIYLSHPYQVQAQRDYVKNFIVTPTALRLYTSMYLDR